MKNLRTPILCVIIAQFLTLVLSHILPPANGSIPTGLSLFIAINSKLDYKARRDEARRSWLQWISKLDNSFTVDYKFFTDDTAYNITTASYSDSHLKASINSLPCTNLHSKYYRSSSDLRSADLVFMPIPAGRSLYGARGLFQLGWFATNYPGFDFFLKVDDDSFLCLPRIMGELSMLPKSKFVWTKYWHQNKRTRIDENFLLISKDVAKFILDATVNSYFLPFDIGVDFGINFSYWAQVLNLTVYDDQSGFDSQQSYLTSYMHRPLLSQAQPEKPFCSTFKYAHHVAPGRDDWFSSSRENVSRV